MLEADRSALIRLWAINNITNSATLNAQKGELAMDKVGLKRFDGIICCNC